MPFPIHHGGGTDDQPRQIGKSIDRAGRPLAGQSGSRVWMLLEHPTVAGVISMDCRPLDGGATYLLITLYAEGEDALVTAAPELTRMLASLRTTGTAPAS